MTKKNANAALVYSFLYKVVQVGSALNVYVQHPDVATAISRM